MPLLGRKKYEEVMSDEHPLTENQLKHCFKKTKTGGDTKKTRLTELQVLKIRYVFKKRK